MKKICIIILIVTISLTAIIVTINLKKEEKIKQENTASIQEMTEITITNYNGRMLKITQQNDIDTIKNILSNLKFDKPSSDGMISFIITMNDENYCFKNQGKTVTKGEEMRYYNRNPIQTSNTNGYEIPKEPRMQVKKIENKEDYIDLLLEADPSKDMIHKYLNDSDVYALKKEDELISIAVILHIDRKTLELKNIVTKENYRNKGYAKTLLKSLCGNYKQKYDRMLVGTTENNIPFYVKQGFDKYEKTIKNFFIDNYKEEIKDGELTCTDLIYYSKDLKKK